MLRFDERIFLAAVGGMVFGAVYIYISSDSPCSSTSLRDEGDMHRNMIDQTMGYHNQNLESKERKSSRYSDHPIKTTQMDVPEVNQTWVKLRKELLSSRRSEAGKASITKVLLLAYQRGGSTFFMDLFNQHPNTSVVWYEALNSFYPWYFGIFPGFYPMAFHYHDNPTRRFVSNIERQRLSQYLEQLLAIDIDNIAIHALAHKGFRSRTKAFEKTLHCTLLENSNMYPTVDCYTKLLNVCSNYQPPLFNLTMALERKCDLVLEALREINPIFTSEPIEVDTVHSTKKILEDEYRELREKVEKMVGQRVSNFRAFLRYHYCVASMEKPVRSCWKEERHIFSQTNLVALKLLRWSLPDIENIILQRPDIYMIHFVRDPRAIAASHYVFHGKSFIEAGHLISTEAKLQCIKMRNDIADKRILEAKYPGLFLTVRYEDYLLRYRETITDIFSFIGREVPEGIFEWFQYATNTEGKDHKIFHTIRSNGTSRVDQWMKEVTYEETLSSNKYCQDILDLYDYNKN